MAGYRRPATPAAVERELRREAGFGCAQCGHPYIEYHHIVPWSEEQHFRPVDMVALCGNCHPAVANWGRDRQYELKNKPFNVIRGVAGGALEYDKRNLLFKVGGSWYEDVPIILKFHDTPLIKCRIDNGQVKVSLTILDETLHQVLVVEDNEIKFRIDDLWDFEYSHRNVIARHGRGNIALRMDFRGDEAIIEGQMWIGTQKIELNPDRMILPGNNQFIGNRIVGGMVGVQIGDPEITLPVRCRLPQSAT